MADVTGQKVSLGLGGPKNRVEIPKSKSDEKVAAKHVTDFTAANFGKKAKLPKIQKIHGQTFRD